PPMYTPLSLHDALPIYIFQPRLSTAKRNEIQNYINELNTFFVSAEIINPDYEEVEVTLGVKFNTGFEENFYTKQLEEDIKKYLSDRKSTRLNSSHVKIS